MVESFDDIKPASRVTVYRPHDDPDGEPSGVATFYGVTDEDPNYAWVVEHDEHGEPTRRYTVHKSDIGENLGREYSKQDITLDLQGQ